MISSDAALGLAVLLFYLALMLWGVFQTFWPSISSINPPSGGRKLRALRLEKSSPVPVSAKALSGRR